MSAESLLARLADPLCYPHAPHHVDLVQTHLSIVCLAGDLVYKLKKAITLPFVDFAPLAARRQACRDEVRLNRRLCPDTYLGTASLRPGHDGPHFAAIGDDEHADDLDVAVVMRRLPQERMLDELLRRGAVDAAAIGDLADHVAAFHARCARPPAAVAEATPRQLAGFAADNFTALRQPALAGLDAPLLDALADATRAAFARLLPKLERRAAAGCVVDGHGDLHARNVCMTSPPTVYDCIEFAPAFRIGDVATEIAFLVMDLRYRGATHLATRFAARYAEVRGDAELGTLLPTLCAYRAMVRAKVAMLAATTAELSTTDRDGARHSAARHLQLAASLALEDGPPRWLVLCGPPASGKSRLAAALAELPAWPVLATDALRKELAGVAPTTPARPEHYSPAFSARTYAELLRRAGALTRQGGRIVVLDGNFPTAQHRGDAAAAARAAGAVPFVVHVGIDLATAVSRATARRHEPGNVSDADAAVTATRHAQFAPPTQAEVLPGTTLDGRLPTERLVAGALAAALPAPSTP